MDRWIQRIKQRGDEQRGDDHRGAVIDEDEPFHQTRKNSVASVWSEIRNTYEATRRDFVYAYGGAEQLIAVNAAYEAMVSRPCAVVLLTHADHSALGFYLSNSERLARLHGVVVFSMCWTRRMDDMHEVVADAEARRFRAQIVRMYRNSKETTVDGEEEVDVEEDEDMDEAAEDATAADDATTAQRYRNGIDVDLCRSAKRFPLFDASLATDEFHYGDPGLYINDSPRAVNDASEDDNGDDDDDDDDDDDGSGHNRQKRKRLRGLFESRSHDGAAANRGDATAAVRTNDDDATVALSTTEDLLQPGGYATTISNNSPVDVIKATYYLHDSDTRDSSCNLRNRILLQFFGKFLYYARAFVICDQVGMAFHKSFRLIDPAVIKQMCRSSAVSSMCTGTAKVEGM